MRFSKGTAIAAAFSVFALVTASASPRIFRSSELTLAIRVINFEKNGRPILSNNETREAVTEINSLFSQCQIRFVPEEIETINPQAKSLPYNLNSMHDLDLARQSFQQPDRLILIHTGPWDHSGMGSANAWTAMPGRTPAGAVIDGAAAHAPEIAAHELGHYLNLQHVDDPANLMNPIIYKTSTRLSNQQCAMARQTAVTTQWQALR